MFQHWWSSWEKQWSDLIVRPLMFISLSRGFYFILLWFSVLMFIQNNLYQGPYHCSVGADKSFGREGTSLILTTRNVCMPELQPVRINGEVMPGQVLLQKPTMYQSLYHLWTKIYKSLARANLFGWNNWSFKSAHRLIWCALLCFAADLIRDAEWFF